MDTSDQDDATTTAEDTASCCHVEELDPTEEYDGVGHAPEQDPPLSLHEGEAGSPRAAHCFKKLLQDFFREGLSSSPCHGGRPGDPEEVERSLLETARAWLDLDGRHSAPGPDGKAEVEEIERRLGRWRRFGEDEREPLGCDVEGGIFWSLVEELVADLC